MNRFDYGAKGREELATSKAEPFGADLDESFFWKLLGIPPCKRGEACNGCGQCGSPQV